jgi:hypothetical protein
MGHVRSRVVRIGLQIRLRSGRPSSRDVVDTDHEKREETGASARSVPRFGVPVATRTRDTCSPTARGRLNRAAASTPPC